jgi:Flp pilus assembly protein CpaB
MRLILAMIAIAATAVACTRMYDAESQARLNATQADPMRTVVVAAVQIPFGTKVELRQLRTITLPSSASVGEHYDKPDQVVGLIALQKLTPGEILLREHFGDRHVGSTITGPVRTDVRAVTVRVDDVTGVAGFLMPGNHVDVVAARMDRENQHAETYTVLRDLNVLAVDQTATQDKDQPVVVRDVTLEVSPRQAEILVKAREEGHIVARIPKYPWVFEMYPWVMEMDGGRKFAFQTREKCEASIEQMKVDKGASYAKCVFYVPPTAEHLWMLISQSGTEQAAFGNQEGCEERIPEFEKRFPGYNGKCVDQSQPKKPSQ